MARKYTAIYYRTSKKSKNGIEMQKKLCNKYCKEKGIKNILCYCDKNISGLKDNRKGFNDLIMDIQKNKIKKVIVYKIDRLGRNFFQLSEFYSLLEKKRIVLTSVTQNFNFYTPEGRVMLGILMLFSEFESRMISKRTIDGLNVSYERRWKNGKTTN